MEIDPILRRSIAASNVILALGTLSINGGPSPSPETEQAIHEEQLAKTATLENAEINVQKARQHHLAKGLGGVAGTGFSRAEVNRARAIGHGTSTVRNKGGFYVTTYGPPWGGINGGGIAATGLKLIGRKRYEVAVDPSVIPLGSLVTVTPNALHYDGAFLAADTGGAVNGSHVDVYNWKGKKTSTYSARGAKVRPYKG